MIKLPAQWEKQDCIMMVFPHKNSDWADDLESAKSVFVKMASAICFKQKLILICDDIEAVKSLFCYTDKITFVKLASDDTWIRDFGVISVYEDGVRKLIDFQFNAWGGKFPFLLDNEITKKLHSMCYFGVSKLQCEDFVLEGGSIESDGCCTILTTSKCLLNPNRNPQLNKNQIEDKLKTTLGAKRILWLNHGELLGDDTDAHIDTLARFIDRHTIAYVSCDDKTDPQYDELLKMKMQLKTFLRGDGKPYRLIPLPLPSPKYKKGKRLPATYANFLITNFAVLLPVYEDVQDKKMITLFKELFPSREIIPINSIRLIEEGGSIHCSTMDVCF